MLFILFTVLFAELHIFYIEFNVISTITKFQLRFDTYSTRLFCVSEGFLPLKLLRALRKNCLKLFSKFFVSTKAEIKA